MFDRQFSNIIAFLPDATFVINSEKKIIAWNKAIEKMTGLKQKEMIGKGDYEYALPFYHFRRPMLIDLVWLDNREIELGYDYIEHDEETVFAETFFASLGVTQNVYLWGKASPLHDQDGNIVGAIESIRDITAWKKLEKGLQKERDDLEATVSKRTLELRKTNETLLREMAERWHTEEALIKAERKYLSIFEHAVEGIFQTAPDGHFIDANPTIAQILGYHSPEELIHTVNNIGTQIYVDRKCRSEFTRLLKENSTTQHFETQCYRKDGSIIWVSISSRSVCGENGEILYFEGFLEDITEYKKAEEALKESEERYRIAIEHSNDGVAIIKENTHVYVNQKFLDIFGYDDRSEIVGKSTNVTIHPDDQRMVAEYARMRFRGEVSPSRYEFKALRKDGALIYIEVSIAAIIYERQKAILCYLHDVTERKKMEDELLKTKKLESIGILAGGIAHDFNNMLSVILGYISLAKLRANPEEKLFSILQNAEKMSIQASDLTKKFITFSKGGVPIKKEVDIVALIKKTAEYSLSGSKVQCSYSLEKDQTLVPLDEGQMQQVIHNIILNAREAMSDSGEIHISVTGIIIDNENCFSLRPGEYTKISFNDQGVGIPDENLVRIFDPYFTTKDMGPQKGMGLGLAVCYSVLKSHGGLITADSRVGQGSTFIVYLPLLSNG
jgi:PAS domain S-box-containing protein